MERLNFKIDFNEKNNLFSGIAYLEDNKVCECKMSVVDGTWTISSWFTVRGYMHKGYGTQTLSFLLKAIEERFGLPTNVEYIWNGANSYVLDWLCEHFDATCKCPIAVLKYQCDDDWESHMYILDKDKFIEYFELDK